MNTTTNVTLAQGNDWTRLNVGTADNVTVESVEEGGVEIITTADTTAPANTLRGHTMEVGKSWYISEIGTGAVWVRSPLGEAIIVVS